MQTRMDQAGRTLLFGLAAILVIGCAASKKPSQCKNTDYVKIKKELAIAHYQKGNYIDALREVKDAEQCQPDDAELYYWMGLIYFQRQKSYDAIDCFEKSLEIDPDYVESRMALGIVLLDLERWDEAISHFEVAANDDLFRRPWEAYNNLGWAYLQKGELKKAEDNLKKAINLNGNYCIAYCNLGEVYSKSGSPQKAITNFRASLDICPDNYARPHLLLGLEYGKMNKPTLACQELQAAARIKNQKEAEQAMDYLALYNCPGVVLPPPGGGE